VFNVPKHTLFPSNYHYRARNTPSVLKSFEELVNSLKDGFIESMSGKKILDIGCNDGSLLDCFFASGAITYGIDPTGAAKEAADNHIILNEYFSPFSARTLKELIGGFPDIITFTNCFAHIEKMHELITSLSCLMGPDTLVVIENHYLKSVLERNQFDTFYHEHPRTYSIKSFEIISDLLGASLLFAERTQRYGGNIRVYISRNYGLKQHPYLQDEFDFLNAFNTMASFIPKWIHDKRAEIQRLALSFGPMTGIAFPGRASILINLLSLTTNELAATYEIKGSKKTGCYIPGTRIPILPEHELFDSNNRPSTVLNLAWHIKDDVIRNLTKYNYNPNIISIL